MHRVPELGRAIRRSDARRPVGPTCDSSETVEPCERSPDILTSRSSTTRTAPRPVAEKRAISPAPASRKTLGRRRDAGRMTQTPRAPSRSEGRASATAPPVASALCRPCCCWPSCVGRAATALLSSSPRKAHRTCSFPAPVLRTCPAPVSSILPAMRRLRLAPPKVFAAVSLSRALCSPAMCLSPRPPPTVFSLLSHEVGAFCLSRWLSGRKGAVAPGSPSP